MIEEREGTRHFDAKSAATAVAAGAQPGAASQGCIWCDHPESNTPH